MMAGPGAVQGAADATPVPALPALSTAQVSDEPYMRLYRTRSEGRSVCVPVAEVSGAVQYN
jgi:hypothetical protein